MLSVLLRGRWRWADVAFNISLPFLLVKQFFHIVQLLAAGFGVLQVEKVVSDLDDFVVIVDVPIDKNKQVALESTNQLSIRDSISPQYHLVLNIIYLYLENLHSFYLERLQNEQRLQSKVESVGLDAVDELFRVESAQ